MPEELTVVIIDSDSDSISRMEKYIENLGDHCTISGVAKTFEKGFELIHKKKPAIVIMEVTEDLKDSIEKINTVLARFPQVTIFATCADKSSDTILKIMKAGAAEYILRPVEEEDLASSLQKIGRLWISKPSEEAEEGKVITIFSPKGGVGVTTIAVNLATNIFALSSKPTLLVDLDLDAGDATTFLNMKSTYTISDVTVNMSRLDENFLKGVITQHESGIFVLAEPHKVEEGVSISGADVYKLFKLLKTMFSYIVVDTESVVDERILKAIEISDQLVMVGVLTLPGIKHMQRHLSYFDEHGIDKSKISMAINRLIKKGDITIADAEKVFGRSVKWTIPNDYETSITSLNKGIPASSHKPHSALNTAINDMAKSLLELELVKEM